MGQQLPPDFNPGAFLYLNPELIVQSNVNTTVSVINWAQSNNLNGLQYSLDSMPTDFDSVIFLTGSKTTIDISPLNQQIYQSLKNEGLDDVAIDNRARYINTIHQEARHLSNGIFQFNNPATTSSNNIRVGSNSVQVGDFVRLHPVNRKTAEYATVCNIDYAAQVLSLCNIVANKQFKPPGTDYIIDGIKLYDVERLATINYLREKAASNIEPIVAFYQDTEFNPKLYRLLYPESELLNDASTYVEYVSLMSNNQKRIGKVEDLAVGGSAALGFTSNFDNLAVNYQLRLPSTTSSIVFKDTTVYGISTDDLIKSKTLYPNRATPKLITEYAIKKYIDRSYEELAVFNNVEVYGYTDFYGPVTLKGPYPFFAANINTCNLAVSNCLRNYGETFLLGDASLSNNLFVNSNIITGETLSVGSSAYISSNLYVNGSILCSNDAWIGDSLTVLNSGYFACNLVVGQQLDVVGSVFLHSNVFMPGDTYSSNLSASNAIVVSLASSNAMSSNISVINLDCMNYASFSNLTASNAVIDNIQLLSIHGSNAAFSNLTADYGMIASFTATDSFKVESDAYMCGTAYSHRVCVGPVCDGSSNNGSNNTPMFMLDNNGTPRVQNLFIASNLDVGQLSALSNNNLVTINGAISAMNYNTFSDRRLKHSISDIDSNRAISIMKALRPVEYQMRLDDTRTHYGFIADEVSEIFAESIDKLPMRVVPCNILCKVLDVDERDSTLCVKIIGENLQFTDIANIDDVFITNAGVRYKVKQVSKIFAILEPSPGVRHLAFEIVEFVKQEVMGLKTVNHPFIMAILVQCMRFLLNNIEFDST